MSELGPYGQIGRKGELFVIPRSWWRRRPAPRPEPDPEVLEVVRRAHRKRIREYLERRRPS